jgi:hypothetical protein
LTGGDVKMDSDWYYSTPTPAITVLSHEIGHLVGLADRYMSDDSCNPNDTTVMDATRTSGDHVIEGCDGNSAGPMFLDRGRALGFYNWRAPGNVTSSSTASHMYVSWRDDNWSEYDYPVHIYRWESVPGQWVFVQTYYYNQSIGWMDYSEPGDTWFDWYRLSYNRPPGTSQACIQVYHHLYGNQAWVCAPYRSVY